MKKTIYRGPEDDFGLSRDEYVRLLEKRGAERLFVPYRGDSDIHYFDQQLVTVVRKRYHHEEEILDGEHRYVKTRGFQGIILRLLGNETGFAEIEKLILDEAKKKKSGRETVTLTFPKT